MNNPFKILQQTENLNRTYLCNGYYNQNENDFIDVLKNLNINIKAPGHYNFIGNTFGKKDADELNDWYLSNATAEENHTVAVIAPDTIKDDAQQLLLKLLEEVKPPYVFFLFLPDGFNVLETVKSRSTLIDVAYVYNKDTEVDSFLKMKTGDRIKKVATDIKKMESSEIRSYTENLNRKLIQHFHNEDFIKNKDLLIKLNKANESLITGHIAPKFVLDYIVTIL